MLMTMKGKAGKGLCSAWLFSAAMIGGAAMQPVYAQDAAGDIFDLVNAGDAAGVEQALASGVDVNIRDELGQTPMVVAALAGQGGVAWVLLRHGADIKARTDKGMTALHAAAYAGDMEILSLLLDNGASVNDQENFAHITPLHAAAEENHPQVVFELVYALKADPSLVDVKGYTASTLAGWKQNWSVVQILVRNGDVCQPEAIAGPWVYEKCMELAAGAVAQQSN
jgi:uncharacterized protein